MNMMTTRFDDIWWITGKRHKMSFQQMATDHMLNICRMMFTRPSCVVNMMLQDIDSHRYRTSQPVIPWGPDMEDIKIESIRNITSLNADDLVCYAFNSRLGVSLQTELHRRGVCLGNYLSLLDAKVEVPFLTVEASEETYTEQQK